MYYNTNDYRDYLAHHGILGMRWGKRNGPPYPLGVSDHSASEKKAGWRNSLKTRKEEKIKRKQFKRQEKLYNELSKIEKEKGQQGLYEYVSKNYDRSLTKWQNTNKTAHELSDLALDTYYDAQALANKLHKETAKSLGANSYEDYVRKNGGTKNVEALVAYAIKGYQIAEDYMKTDEGKAYQKRENERDQKLDRLKKQYEKECRDYIKSELGEYAEKKCASDTAIKFDLNGGPIQKQTIEDALSFAMLRRAYRVVQVDFR